MPRRLKDIVSYPRPARVALFEYLRKLNNRRAGNRYDYRVLFSEVERPEYGYCL